MPAATQVALLGAGFFATATYIPILKQHRASASLAAVWSRSEASASDLLSKAQE